MEQQESKKDSQTRSNFNFVSVVEDTIEGILSFAEKFIKITLAFVFKPTQTVDLVRSDQSTDDNLWHRPYAFLAIAIFLLLKGVEHLPRLRFPDIEEKKTISSNFDIHGLIANIQEISTLKLILTILPAAAVIIMLGHLIARIAGGTDIAFRKRTAVMVSYAFGVQSMLFLVALLPIVLIKLFVFKAPIFLHSKTASLVFYLATSLFALGILLYAFSLPVIVLNAWFRDHRFNNIILKRKWIRLALFLALSALVTVGYISILTLSKEEIKNIKSLSVKVMEVMVDKKTGHEHLDLSLFLDNLTNEKYVIQKNGRMLIPWITKANGQEQVDDRDSWNRYYTAKEQHDAPLLKLGPQDILYVTYSTNLSRNDLDKMKEDVYIFLELPALEFMLDGNIKDVTLKVDAYATWDKSEKRYKLIEDGLSVINKKGAP